MRESTEALWSSLQAQLSLHSTQSLDWLSTAVQECGLLPLKLSHGCLIQREYRDLQSGWQIDELLARMSVLCCLADGRCLASTGSVLTCRELDLVRHGASKTGLNTVLNAISMAENVGRPVCLMLLPWPDSELPVSPSRLSDSMRLAWPSNSRSGYRAAVFLLPRDGSQPPVRVEMDSLARTANELTTIKEQAAFQVRAVLVTFEMGSAAAAKLRFRGS